MVLGLTKILGMIRSFFTKSSPEYGRIFCISRKFMNLSRKQFNRIKKLMQVMTFVLFWQFAFPQHAMAQEITPSQAEQPDLAFMVPADEQVEPAVPVALKVEKAIPPKPKYKVKKSLTVVMTAYSSTRAQTDSDPFTTASGEKVRDGVIAMNRVPFGTKIRIPEEYGDKVFVVKDRMSARYGKTRGDIWMKSYKEAKQWGVKRVRVEILES